MRLQVKVIKRAITAAFLGLTLMLPALSSVAQDYGFEPDTGTFTSIRDTGTSAHLRFEFEHFSVIEERLLDAIHIPFEFYFFGKRIETIIPSDNLFLTTNTSSVCEGERSCRRVEEDSLSGSPNHQGGIYPFWTDSVIDLFNGSTRVLYQLSGDPGNQILTIEYSQFPLRDDGFSNSLSAQVKLYENDGRIEFIYQREDDIPIEPRKAFVGIAATAEYLTDSTVTRYYSVQDFDSPTVSQSNFKTFPEDRTENVRPQDGQVFRFTPEFYLPKPPDLNVAVDTELSYTMPEAIYPNGEVTYTLEDLPTGFTFANRVISGMSSDMTDEETQITLTYEATDDDGTVSQTFIFAVVADTTPSFGTETIDPFELVQNNSFVRMHLPTSATGNAPLTYTISPALPQSPALPAGLSFDAANNYFYGVPTEALPSTTYTYTVTDTDGEMASIDFEFTAIQQLTAPNAMQAFVFIPGESVTETLTGFTGGRGTPTYRLLAPPTDPAFTPLPSNLVFAAGSRLISGMIYADNDTPNNFGPTEYTYTAFDTNGVEASETFTIEVVDAIPVAPRTVDNLVYTVGVTMDVPLPEFTTSVDDRNDVTAPTLTHSLRDAMGDEIDSTNPLISGLMWTLASRTIDGTPTEEAAAMEYTYSATDGFDSAELTFTIAVEAATELERPDILNMNFTTTGQAQTVTLDPFMDDTGGSDGLTHSLSDGTNTNNGLVGGISFNPATRTITIPATSNDDSLATTFFTYTASDSGGDSASVSFSITIVDEIPEFADDAMIPLITGIVGTDIMPVLAPVVETEGTTTTSYSFDSSLSWLMLNTTTNMLQGRPIAPIAAPNNMFTFTATDADGDTDTVMFTITVEANTTPMAPTTIPDGGYTFAAGQVVAATPETTLPAFTGGNGVPTYSLALSSDPEPRTPVTTLVGNLMFNATSRQISGTVTETNDNDSVMATEYTYSATDEDGDTAMTTFTITITDNYLMPPTEPQAFSFEPGDDVNVTLDPHTGGPGDPITYALITTTTPALPGDLALNSTSRVISGTLPDSTMAETTYTYTATSGNEMHEHTFTIAITDVPDLNMATASAIPTVGANIALVASQAISSRVELALNGLSSGIDIRTLDGPQLRLNPQQQNGGSGSSVRFGVWYSAASDSLSDTRSTVTWEGTTDSTNLGFDVGFDLSESTSLVVGILQNSSSTSATYRNTGGDNAGILSVDLDSTAFYVGLGYDWLDAWFANGSADSTLNDSQIEMGIPASFSYQTIGLTVAFEVADSFNIGGKLESLTSDLSLAAMDDVGYDGLSTDSSQLRTAFVANYQLELGESGNGLLIPKFELGFRDLSLGTNITESAIAAVAAVGGSAMETGFGIDYSQLAWGLTVGLDIRSISVENYSSDSTQYQIRWESGDYGSGFSFQLTPHSVSETLGGIDSLYSGGYNQYQSVLERQRGGDSAQDSKGLDFEVGYGFVAGYGTVTPYLKTTNYRGSGNRAQEFGIRYQTLSGLELSLTAERELTPQTLQILGFPLTFTQQENALTFNTRYSF